MKTMKQTKLQLLNSIRQHIDFEQSRGTDMSHMSEILDGVETSNELKLTLVDFANKFYHIRSLEQNNQDQWYLGDKFYYTKYDIFEYIQAIHKIAEITNYDLYSKNEWWFIKSY
jgi:hypothetical protein